MKKTLSVLFLALGIAALALFIVVQRVDTPYKAFDGAEQFVEIPAGVGSRGIADRLVASGVVHDRLTFRAALWMTGAGKRLKAGEYRFDAAMTPRQVVDKIARGDVFVINLTFPEGLTIRDMALLFEQHGFGPRGAFIEAAKNPALITGLDPAASDLEGYLYPDTYPLSRRTDARALVRLMASRFEKAFSPELRAAAAARGWSVRQVVTLASLVEKETGKAEERPVVAAVYANRLRIKMGLQCDPTVIYALDRVGKYTGRLRRDDLRFDSPYNTYRYPGLPPGPIASPGLASIRAALAPADRDYLYFVSRNDGTHEFSRTLGEHNRNVMKFQILPFRERQGKSEAAASGPSAP